MRSGPGVEDAIQHYKETFYVNVTNYEHDSLILEDRAVIPYANEKTSVALSGRFGARYHITVFVFPHGADMDNDDNAIEKMESDFLNW